MRIRKKTLQLVNSGAYTFPVAETTAAGFGDLTMMADDRRSAVFLRPYAFARPVNGWAWAGRPSGLPVPSCRFANPVQCPPTPFGDGKRAFFNHDGGRTMLRHIPARPEQSQLSNFLTGKVSVALRSAALAPNLASALDIAGAALVDIATIARSECQTAARSFPSTHDTAASALQALDRIAGILEAIERLASDDDGAIADLAGVARGLLAHQISREELIFTSTVCQVMAAEVSA
ncbi:hypothetical protein [Burkholderia contaminans]|uniref:Uncharacterized protein n=1 Tax=Burkholderia contaminans TaxID=488447 RepID=A0A6P2Y6I3_9BURK|nr:hypothetical protein [Burkholderia contaminans]VWD17354.1 hypothetical protein BCO71171_02946 [Burkholderia contaminans]